MQAVVQKKKKKVSESQRACVFPNTTDIGQGTDKLWNNVHI